MNKTSGSAQGPLPRDREGVPMNQSVYPHGKLIYENPLASEADLKDFVLE